jgi:hypothetical protein
VNAFRQVLEPVAAERFSAATVSDERCGRDEPRHSVRSISVRSLRCRSAVALALVLALSVPLGAHDIYSSWTDVTLRAERLELTLTLARASAPRLLSNGNALPPITPDNFAEFAPPLKAVAAQLFEISAAGKPLKLTSCEVGISGDADITFHLVYPRAAPGTLRFAVNYLFHLVDGHVGTLVVTDSAGKDLGWSPVSVDQPVFEVRVPAPTRPARKP